MAKPMWHWDRKLMVSERSRCLLTVLGLNSFRATKTKFFFVTVSKKPLKAASQCHVGKNTFFSKLCINKPNEEEGRLSGIQISQNLQTQLSSKCLCLGWWGCANSCTHTHRAEYTANAEYVQWIVWGLCRVTLRDRVSVCLWWLATVYMADYTHWQVHFITTHWAYGSYLLPSFSHNTFSLHGKLCFHCLA